MNLMVKGRAGRGGAAMAHRGLHIPLLLSGLSSVIPTLSFPPGILAPPLLFVDHRLK